VLNAYYRVADHLYGVSPECVRANLTLANSDWTRRMLADVHGVRARTLYPPVPVSFRHVPWDDRMDGFICLGRIAPEKELDSVIDIVAGVRHRFPHVQLCIVGTPGPRRYYRHIRARADAAGGWITLRENLTRAELLDLLPRYRYGIHGMREEHFGMAPAEMAAAGCIVFLPNGGGQVEIVNGDARLVFDTPGDAVGRIVRVLESPEERQSLREMLAARAEGFSAEHFVDEFRTIVRQFAVA
jgi:glycosyltransferase involved in cell wall biosynthesis